MMYKKSLRKGGSSQELKMTRGNNHKEVDIKIKRRNKINNHEITKINLSIKHIQTVSQSEVEDAKKKNG